MVLMTNAVPISPADEQRLVALLETEYEQECVHWPHTPPAWRADAAVWAAKILFHTAQLVLYRKQTIDEVRHLFANYTGHITPGAILSADLCLRFLPHCIVPLTGLNDADELIGILQTLLADWHYSAIGDTNIPTPSNFAVIQADACLSQLYTDRVIARKHRTFALHPQLQPLVVAALGQHMATFWPDFCLETTTNEQFSITQ